MKNRVITISREFGSGGRTIGKSVATQLGIPCYHSELIHKIASERGSGSFLRYRDQQVPRRCGDFEAGS